MSDQTSREATQGIVRMVLAADCACPESAFVDDRLLVTPAEERAGRRRYPSSTKPLGIVTMGRGVVVSCYTEWIAPLRAILVNRSRDEIFASPTMTAIAHHLARDGAQLFGPAVSYVCATETLRPATVPPEVAIDVVEGKEVFNLYQYPGFERALSYRPDHERPDVAAAVARRAGTIVGIAGMSADCDALWQIGIDVVEGARGVGIGRALVGQLTELAFQRDRVPSYTADLANLRSHALAVSLGYWPSWVELFARELSPG